ncbi:MAG: acetyl-CoA carboxylase biotin carboxyl carrier protein subunit [Flavobacterium sp. BFFFF2]|nr:MAG: acetyl-CoA carboxylase biotin carboxyl carrier protein subunit [Flavobacterium sp. BFFFF2]
MNMSYKLTVNQTHQLETTDSELNELDAVVVQPGTFHVLLDHKPYQAKIIESDFLNRQYAVEVNGNRYDVAIGNELDILIQKIGIERGKSKKVNVVKAPMPGLLLEVFVQVGDVVEEHQPLLILEAMKMENSLLSPRQGTIKTIAVKQGTAVEKGQLLIEFE